MNYTEDLINSYLEESKNFRVIGIPKKFDELLTKYPEIEIDKVGPTTFEIITHDYSKADIFGDSILNDMNPAYSELTKDGIIVDFDDESILEDYFPKEGTDWRQKCIDLLSMLKEAGYDAFDDDFTNLPDPLEDIDIFIDLYIPWNLDKAAKYQYLFDEVASIYCDGTGMPKGRLLSALAAYEKKPKNDLNK